MEQGDIRYYCRLALACFLFVSVLLIFKEPETTGLVSGLSLIGFALAVDWRFLN